jgi:hypothetical protein
MGYYEGNLELGCNNGNGGMFGNNGDWIWAFLLFALIGNNGWGGAGFGGGYGVPYAFGGFPATQADVRAAVDQQTLISKIDQQTYGLADTFNSLNNTLNNNFRSVDNAICNLGYNIATQFAGVDKAFCTQGYQTQAGFNALANQISSCCCDLKQLNLENRYLNEKQTCEIVSAINAGNQRLVDIYTADKMASKDAKIAALESKISNAEQSAYLLNELKPCPKASYIVPNPNCCYNYGVFPTGACGASVQ